jgi:hypothetical protein
MKEKAGSWENRVKGLSNRGCPWGGILSVPEPQEEQDEAKCGSVSG